MNVVSQIDKTEFFELMQEALEEELITTEEILTHLVWNQKGILADEELFVNTCMKNLECL